MKHTLPIVAVLLAFACSTPSTETDLQTILLPSPQSPLIALRVTFDAGSIYDPPGRNGWAALTASMISDAGTAKRTYTELGEALYPLAVAIRGWTDREISVFSAQVHRERLDELTDVFVEVLLEPGFREEDFERNREQLLGTLTSTLRSGNDELLGLEMIQQAVFAGHPYGHASQGTVEGLAAVTLDDVKTFYRDHYVRSSAMLGIAGGYPEGYDRSALFPREAPDASRCRHRRSPAVVASLSFARRPEPSDFISLSRSPSIDRTTTTTR
jgi:zinc protease